MRMRAFILAAISIIGFSFPARAESRRIMGGSAGGKKYQFFYETFLDPSYPELGRLGGGTVGGEGTIHRFMADRGQRVYFGYDVSIQELPQPNTYQLTFSQLGSESIRDILGDDASSWTQLPSPDWGGPAIRTVQAGEVLSLDLLMNSTTGQKIVDYVSVKGSSFDPDWHFIYETGTAQDFHVEDAALDIANPQLSVNGQAVNIPGAFMYGPAVWFYLPMHGRFILSLVPHAELGFQKAGEVRGTTLNFTAGNDTFNMISSQRIAPGQHAFNLYVLHEPDWQPESNNRSKFPWGDSDSPEKLLDK